MLKTAELYDMSHTLAGAYLSGFEYPWQALKLSLIHISEPTRPY